MSDTATVWVINASNSQFPGGIFSNMDSALAAISKWQLTGTLTEYPLDELVYDHAIKMEWFEPKTPKHCSPAWVGGFTSARQQHYHFENGSIIS